MKIDKAISTLTELSDPELYNQGPNDQEAIQLGIEALKFFKGLEDTGALPNDARLPGETKG